VDAVRIGRPTPACRPCGASVFRWLPGTAALNQMSSGPLTVYVDAYPLAVPEALLTSL
jgi:hypothetical protein